MLIGFAVAPAFGRLPGAATQAFLCWWARGILRALGVRLQCAGGVVEAPALIVANHVSWLDGFALLASQPAVFVCKSEVASWPGIGWLLKRARTIFIRRGSFRDVWRVNIELRSRFEAHHSVAVFPEGTTTPGDKVLEFRPALFQPAVERDLPVRPVAIAYSGGEASYCGDTTLLESLLAICRAGDLEARVAVLPALPAGLTRREAAQRARRAIVDSLAGGAVAPAIAELLEPADVLG